MAQIRNLHQMFDIMLRCISILLFITMVIAWMMIAMAIDPYPIGIHSQILTGKSPSSARERSMNLNQWLSGYPLVEAQGIRRCDSYKCQPTFNHTTNEWLDQHIALIPKDPWSKAHESQSEELVDPNQQCQYVFIGDSIIYKWNKRIFDRNFNQNQSGVIYAQNGDKVHEIGWRLNQGDGFKNMRQCMLSHKSPQKSIVLLIGTNDVGFFGGPYDVAVRDYDALLNQFGGFLEDINKEQRVVLNVLAIFPRGKQEWDGTNSFFHTINFINEYLKSFIERQDNRNMRFIDCNRYLLQRSDSVDWTDSKGGIHRFITGYINTTILPDRLHLSATGYELWTKCLKQHLK